MANYLGANDLGAGNDGASNNGANTQLCHTGEVRKDSSADGDA